MAIIIMDIDGVLNPLFSFTLQEDGYVTITTGWTTWSLNYRLQGKWMKELIDAGHTIVWCSSWEQDANIVAQFFNLPELDYVKFEARSTGLKENETWKLKDVISYLKDSEETVFWLDDEVKEDAFDWARYRGKTHIIKCNPSEGWTLQQYEELKVLLNTKL
jgi:hypothetical protein